MTPLRVPAPAKVNLFLHVVGRRDDGYHLLESLTAFAEIGDIVEAMPAADFGVTIDGPFAAALPTGADNAVSRAVRFLAQEAGQAPHLALRLTKTLPVAAGLGGGSSDAAAALRACRALWRLRELPAPARIAAALGADVPVCLAARPAVMTGIGERVREVRPFPHCPVVLVNPGVAVPTAEAFRTFGTTYSRPRFEVQSLGWATIDELIAFLRGTDNDLTAAACRIAPAIGEVQAALGALPGCQLARMSGSGATCFGLFADADAARAAAERLHAARPGWWVTATALAAAV
jgi:4-diphosphocytidyl-2-C-methyl-D-erythritol kinase